MRAVERGGCKKGEIPMGRLFGTDGVRGVAGEDMTCELAMDIGRAAATVLTYEACIKNKLRANREG